MKLNHCPFTSITLGKSKTYSFTVNSVLICGGSCQKDPKGLREGGTDCLWEFWSLLGNFKGHFSMTLPNCVFLPLGRGGTPTIMKNGATFLSDLAPPCSTGFIKQLILMGIATDQ